jgi:hypothetical protein
VLASLFSWGALEFGRWTINIAQLFAVGDMKSDCLGEYYSKDTAGGK